MYWNNPEVFVKFKAFHLSLTILLKFHYKNTECIACQHMKRKQVLLHIKNLLLNLATGQ